MKKTIICLIASFLCLSLQAQKPAAFHSATPPPRPEGNVTVSNFAPNTRMFLRQWNEYQNALQTAHATKSTQGKQNAQTRLSQLKDTYGLRAVKSTKGASRYELPVFVRYELEEALQSAIERGLKVNTKLKTICTGMIAPEDLPALNGLSGIRYVEAATKATPIMDSARIFTKADFVQQGGSPNGANNNGILKAYRGEGVIVGIVDIGFDYTHPTFYDPDDTTVYRVKRVWDQKAESGTVPEGYDYGAEYTTTADILAAQHDQENYESHGSHVAGIAGGSGAGTPFGGMAPKSDLVFVPTTMSDIGVLDGIKYIKDYAENQKKPCVVNLSIGGYLGPHDGTSTFDQACDELKSDGFVLVGAASNDGSTPLYFQHDFTANTDDTAVQTCIDWGNLRDNKYTWMDAWSDNDDDFYVIVALLGPDGAVLSETPMYTSYTEGDTITTYYLTKDDETDTAARIYCQAEHNPVNNKAHILLEVSAHPLDGEDFDDYTIVLAFGSIHTDRTMSFQMWARKTTFTKKYDHPIFKAGNITHTVGEIGGTGNSIISVGAYVSRKTWINLDSLSYGWTGIQSQHIAPFSSHGPTADGRMKPDITAPGCHIISAYNSFDQADNTMHFVQTVTRNERTYYFGNMQGTSMASPAAAGIIALWLQADPTLNVDKVRSILKETALDYPEAYTPGQPENTWGYGKIDALGGLQYIFKNKPEVKLITVITEEAENITSTSATLYLSVENHTDDAKLGFYYDTKEDIKQGQFITAIPDKDNVYKAEIKNLQPNTLYYFKASGTQADTTVYGQVKSFHTLEELGNETFSSSDVLIVYPNPVPQSGQLIVELPFEPLDATLNITEINGKMSKIIPVHSRKITITDLKTGVYVLQIDRTTANGKVRHQAKVIVQ
ncbi:MAG: S8 family serine peptidase [Bacteroidales bacterium]|nr:S8 family serine peptidase [Bacteroidales bacterium]